MCYSAEVSFGTVGIVALIAIYHMTKARVALALILLLFVFMQAVEGVLWLHPSCDTVNRMASRMIPLVLAAQPLVFAAILLFSSYGTSPALYKGILLLGLIGLPFYLQTVKTSCIREGADGHLEWNIQPFGELSASGERSASGELSASSELLPLTTNTLFTLYYYGAILLCTVTMRDPFLAASFSAMFIVSFWLIRDRYPRSWGSVWCHAINAIAILSLLRS
jgi:hypothetical protein